ncbi:MAG TPA: type II secretion system F family protein [Patescibacteria group bacterium]|nr:type II secretion system F family protein [Patescibacteria group bacterium]
MELYYKAITRQGKILHGRVEAKDKNEAASYLRSHEIYPINISDESEQPFANFNFFKPHTSTNDLIFFTRQLSSMLISGLTLMQALSVMRNQIHNKALSEVLQGITPDIQNGNSFTHSLAKYPKVFSTIYVSSIKAGEKAGLLDKVLLRLADNLEKSKELRDTIRGALIYPMIVSCVMLLVLVVMMVFVIPQLSNLYSGMNVQLPLITRLVIGTSKVFITGLPVIIILVFVGIYFFRRFYRKPQGRLIVDSLLLKIPLFGRLIEESTLVEFTRTFSLLIGTGSLVVESLHQCAETVGNVVYRQAVNDIGNRVEQGVAIGDAFAANELFPSLLVETVKIGEQTGKMDESLMRVSEYFEREVEQAVKALTTAIEPMIIVILGAFVGVLIVSIITPIYGLISSIH